LEVGLKILILNEEDKIRSWKGIAVLGRWTQNNSEELKWESVSGIFYIRVGISGGFL
jgi:hypothetical protein